METISRRLFHHPSGTGEDQLAEFFNILKSMSPTLKFTMESDRSGLSFLDVMIIKKWRPRNNGCIL